MKGVRTKQYTVLDKLLQLPFYDKQGKKDYAQ